MTWPISAAADCAAWLREVLRLALNRALCLRRVASLNHTIYCVHIANVVHRWRADDHKAACPKATDVQTLPMPDFIALDVQPDRRECRAAPGLCKS